MNGGHGDQALTPVKPHRLLLAEGLRVGTHRTLRPEP